MMSRFQMIMLTVAALVGAATGGGFRKPGPGRTKTTHTATTATHTSTTATQTSVTRTHSTKTSTTQTASTTTMTASTQTSSTHTTTWPHYSPQDPALLNQSNAPVFTFFMYRVEGDSNYPWENVNAANLPGILWYLHNEVVSNTPRKFGATKILRYKVHTRAPTPLHKIGMNFGLRYAYDYGMCSGPYDCQDQFEKYGYFVGCNHVDQYPTYKWNGKSKYPEATWYSLPGPCGSKTFNNRNALCKALEPGGHCAYPTGQGNCTYSYEPAGFIYINQLVGIGNYHEFVAKGGVEYNRLTDNGTLTTFWNNMDDVGACKWRIDAARRHFAWKYGWHDLPSPKCDFNLWKFFPDGKFPKSHAPKPPGVWYA